MIHVPGPRTSVPPPPRKEETHFFYLTIERDKLPELVKAIELSAKELRGYSVTHRECDNQWSQDGSMVEYHIEISGPPDYGCCKATQLFGWIVHQMDEIPLKRQLEDAQISLDQLKRLLSDVLEMQSLAKNRELRQAFSDCISITLRMRDITAEQVAEEAGVSKTTLYAAMNGDNSTTDTMFALINVLGIDVSFSIMDQRSWEKARSISERKTSSSER